MSRGSSVMLRRPPEPASRSNCRPVSISTIGRLRWGELSGVPASRSEYWVRSQATFGRKKYPGAEMSRPICGLASSRQPSTQVQGAALRTVEGTVHGGGVQLAPHAPWVQLQELPTERVKFTSSLSKPVTTAGHPGGDHRPVAVTRGSWM